MNRDLNTLNEAFRRIERQTRVILNESQKAWLATQLCVWADSDSDNDEPLPPITLSYEQLMEGYMEGYNDKQKHNT